MKEDKNLEQYPILSDGEAEKQYLENNEIEQLKGTDD